MCKILDPINIHNTGILLALWKIFLGEEAVILCTQASGVQFAKI